jgi:uncharacterized membrane protein
MDDDSERTSDASEALRPALRNVALIREIERRESAGHSALERASDAITRVIGSAGMVVFHLFFFAGWFVWNSNWIGGLQPFDPFPFGILTLIVSAEGVFLAIFVLISQNRMTREAERRARLDLHVNLLCEQSTTKVLQVVDRIAEKLDVSGVAQDAEALQLAKSTDIERLAAQLSDTASAIPRQLDEDATALR